MAFKLGHKKVGGRQKGKLNQDTLHLNEKARALGCDPFEVLIHFVNGDWKSLGYEARTETRIGKGGEAYEVELITPDHRLKAASEACQYLYPKRKAIEQTISASDDVGFRIVVEDYSSKKETK